MRLSPIFSRIAEVLKGGIERRGPNSMTPLILAAHEGSAHEVERLLAAGANVHAVDGDGLTALHHAAYWGETKIVRLLLDHHADPNAGEATLWTPLHAAASAGGLAHRQDIISLLMARGAKPQAPDHNGWTPVDYMTLWEKNAEAALRLKKMFGAAGKHASTPRHPPDNFAFH